MAVPNSAFVTATLSSFNGNFFSVNGSSCSANPSTATTCSFSGNQTLEVTVNPGSLSPGTYNGTISIQSGGVTQNVTVTLTVTSGSTTGGGGNTSAIAAPSSLAFFFQSASGFGSVPQQYIAVNAGVGTFNVSATTTTGQNWLVVSPQTGSGPSQLTVSVSPGGLSAGQYSGSVNISTSSGSLSIPVTLTVTAGPVVEVSPGDIYTSFQAGSPAATAFLQFFASDNSAASITLSTTTPWITLSQNSFTTTQFVQVTVSPATLCNGLNVGSITATTTTANNPITIPVLAQVSGSTVTTGCSGTTVTSLSLSASSLSFSSSNGTTPPSQALTISSSSGTTVSFTYGVSGNVPITALNQQGQTIASGSTLSTPTTLTFSVSIAGLASGTYTDTISFTPAGGTAVTVPVTVTVTAPSVTASPTSLTFSFSAGGAAPAAQTVTVSGTSGAAFTATASSSNNFLKVSPASGTVPGTISVSVDPTNLSAGTYTGTITVAGASGATGSATISVTLTVTAPQPTITSLSSAASYVGGSISPGEIITIFGTAIGPTPGVTLTLDSTGKVSTTLGGVQVQVNGFLAPMVYASSTQVSAVVPYEICTNGCGPGTIAQVIVKFVGQSSNGIPTPVSSTTTGIFTANASGSGQGAILNANNSVNSPGNPANKGDTVAVYLTGEGQTSPAGVTGKVTTISPTGPLTPVPLLPVGVTIGGQPAQIAFAGEAPGLVSGVMQLNVQIPPNAPSGNVPIVVTIGSAASQQGVTVAVR